MYFQKISRIKNTADILSFSLGFKERKDYEMENLNIEQLC